eukprot:4545726-Prymnesium_polylepis.1
MDGSDKELRVPLDFVPPSHSSGLSDLDDDELAAAAEAAEAMQGLGRPAPTGALMAASILRECTQDHIEACP